VKIQTVSAAVVLAAGLALMNDARAAELPSAAQVLKETGVSAGLAVHIGTTDGAWEVELTNGGNLVVQGLARSDEALDKARKYIQGLGMYGPVSVDRLAGNQMPYTDNLVNLLVSQDLGGVTMDEVTRVLAPLGVAYVEKNGVWTKTVKPWPGEIDQWTHFRHDAGGTMMARDTRVGPPQHVQWCGGPMFCRSHEITSSVSTMVSANGRLFYVFDEGLVTLSERWHKSLVPQYRLVARDGFNGVVLWKRVIPNWGLEKGGGRMGWTAHTYHRLVAEGDRVYVTLGMQAPVSALDAATGETVTTHAGTEGTEEILVVADTLVCRTPDRVMALDAKSGRRLWSRESRSPGLRTIVASSLGVAFYDDQNVVLSDIESGRVKWAHPLADVFQLCLGDSWLFCKVEDGLVALAVEDGRHLWRKKGRSRGHSFQEMGQPLFYCDGRLWMNNIGYDPATGEEKAKVKGEPGRGHHPRCYPEKATANYVLTTKRGLEYLDLSGGGETPCDWTRGPCGVGITPCNGLTYVPPHQCACYQGVKLNGFWAYAAESTPGEIVSEDARFERGPAFGKVKAVTVGAHDWPSYRRDERLSASTAARVPSDLEPQWQASIGGKLTSPVAAYGLVAIAAVDQHTVVALDSESGAERWRFVAGGRIDSSPTFHDGMLLFGSADGWVYCLRAADGALVWRYQLAPEQRRICSWGQIESTWPVHGAVLLLDGVAYAVAGRSTYLDGGIHIAGFDPSTGRKLHETTLQGPDPENSPPPNGFWMEGAFSDLLTSDGDRLYMSQIVLDKSLEQIDPPLMNRGGDKQMGLRICVTQGFLADPWYSRGFWMYARRWPGYRRRFEAAPKTGTLLCFNDNTVCVLKAFPVGGHSPTFYPARQGYLLFADDVDAEPQLWGEDGSSQPIDWLPPDLKGRATRFVKPGDPDRVGPSGGDVPYTRGKPPLWIARVPLRVHGMVLAADTLFIAGPPDEVDAEDPLASFEGRLGGKLWAVSAVDGKTLSQCELASPPVFDGMAAANGQLYLSTMDGHVRSYSKRTADDY